MNIWRAVLEHLCQRLRKWQRQGGCYWGSLLRDRVVQHTWWWLHLPPASTCTYVSIKIINLTKNTSNSNVKVESCYEKIILDPRQNIVAQSIFFNWQVDLSHPYKITIDHTLATCPRSKISILATICIYEKYYLAML